MSDSLQALRTRLQLRYHRIPRKVLAFYYGWYGNPEQSGRWLHWEGVDPNQKTIASSTHYPMLGAYDSNDPKVIEQHCQWARQAGLDGFIFSWWGQGRYEEAPLPQLLQSAQKHRLQVCLYYEQVPTPHNPQSVLKDWEYIFKRYATHHAYLKVEGKPVLFIYGRAMKQLSLWQWASVLNEIATRYPPGICAIGDSLSKTAVRIFDGIHTYNPVRALMGKPVGQIREALESHYQEPLQTAGTFQRIRCATILPGYDDTKTRKHGIAFSRHQGESYRVQWETVLNLNPDWVLITSFNEWHEGSEIEPSEEHGDRYLKITAEYAKRFRQLAPPPHMAPPLIALPAQAMRELHQRWKGRTIGILPDPASEAFFWLLENDFTVQLLEWEQVVDPDILSPKHYHAVVYAGGESYRATVHQPGDVDRAIQAYLRVGGRLLVLPSQPFPFYYAEGKPAGDPMRFGLPIAGSSSTPQAGQTGFEQPPVSGLRFAWNRSLIPFAPSEPTPFPTGGDLRWRPMLKSWVQSPNEYLPLVTLQDGTGRYWGEGAGIIRYGTEPFQGAIVGYAWFRLLETPQAPLLLEAMFRLIT